MTKPISLVNYKDITPDGLIKKKLMKEGFGPCPMKGQECSVHYSSELSDGRFVENTQILKEPHIFILGKLSLTPGLEIGIRTMRMGETASLFISPEYSYLSQERHKAKEVSLLSSMKDEEFKLESVPQKTKEELDHMEVKDAKLYLPIIVQIELEKFDDPRPKKTTISPEERITQAVQLKYDGNELFKQKRYNEAIIKYKDGVNYLIQLPNDFYNEKVKDLQNTLYLNISNSHIGLLQYNYALRNLEENIIFKKIPKVFYFKAVCHMHLGEFDEALSNLKILEALMPNDPTVKKAFDDYEKTKERTLAMKKDTCKKGIFGHGGLYAEKEKKTPSLPMFDNKNKCFYIDFTIDKNELSPYKIKFELFGHTKADIKDAFEYVSSVIDNDSLKQREIQFDFSPDNAKSIAIIDNAQLNQNVIDKWNENNVYAPIEAVLLVIHYNKESNAYSIEITTEALSSSSGEILPDYLVLGRCYYNQAIITNLRSTKAKGLMTIFGSDYALNI